MHIFLSYLDQWTTSKQKIFECENFIIKTQNSTVGRSKNSRVLHIETQKLLASICIWDSGELELSALNIGNSKEVLSESFNIQTTLELDDKLNWWLSELTSY